jgi:hypothetical protein
MYCPQCRTEYREGFTECADCQVPLLPGTPPDPEVPFDPTLDPVEVLDTNDQIQLAMAKGLLEDAKIPFFTQGQIATLVTDIDGALHKWIRVYVSRDREQQARELLEQLSEPVPEETTDA